MDITNQIKISLSLALTALFIRCALVDPPPKVTARQELSDLVISEINYNPLPNGAILADEYEYIEFYNKGKNVISLKQIAITDGVDYSFSNTASIKPGEYLVIASNRIEFKNRYKFEPFGEFVGNLKDSGERIALTDMSAEIEFLAFEYSDKSPWPIAADGAGNSLVLSAINNAVDITKPYQWRSSFRINGSPGTTDPLPVYISEIMPHTDPPDEDAIELYNPNSEPVDIGGWYLTDEKVAPAKFRIPQGTIINANSYRVFLSHEFNNPALPHPFNLSEYGEEIYLFSDSSGFPSSYAHGFSYDATENGTTIGLYINSTGEQKFVTQQIRSLGSANYGPNSNHIVINEIMYNPDSGKGNYEYIELKNVSTKTVSFFENEDNRNTWKIRGFNFTFPLGFKLKQGDLVLIVTDSIPVEQFRSIYNVPLDVNIFSSSSGLRNSCDTVTILVPMAPSIEGVDTIIPYKVEESVQYSDDGLWPSADGNGKSLHRKDPQQYADDPNNWVAGAPSPGKD